MGVCVCVSDLYVVPVSYMILSGHLLHIHDCTFVGNARGESWPLSYISGEFCGEQFCSFLRVVLFCSYHVVFQFLFCKYDHST